MTAEGNKYRIYDMDYIRRQILMIGKRKLVFVDNNFYGNDREFFLQRMAMLQELRRAGQFDGWAALVTSDFFLKDENLSLARNAGCEVLFSGVESFDVETLSKFRKYQNTRTPQTALIRKCLSAGILFVYGLILDVTTRPIDDLLAEIEFILGTPDLTLPSYLSVPIPLLRTPFFYECLEKGLLLSNTRLRDLNSTTIAIQTLDPIDRAAAFVRDMQSLRGYRRRTIRHSLGFFRRYRRRLSARQMGIALAQVPLLCAYSLATAPMQWSLGRRSANRTHISSTEPLDPMYTPTLPVAARFADHFQPTVVIDEDGAVAGPLREDLLSHRQITVE